MSAVAVTAVAVVSPGGDSATAALGGTDTTAGWFDHRTRLGARGYRYLPPATQYALAAARHAAGGTGLAEVPEVRRGLALATNGGLGRLFDDMDRQVASAEGAEGLAPVSAPYFALNVLGNRVAADHGLKAFALTMASPRTAAMDAVEAGARALRAGRCDVALVAATEHHLPDAGSGSAPGEEGAVALVLEASDGRQETPVLRAGSLFVPPQVLAAPGGTERAAVAIRAAVRRVTGDAAPGLRVRLILDGSGLAELTARTVAAALAGSDVTQHRTESPLGCLTPALHLADALTGEPGDTLLVTAVHDGHLAITLACRPGARHRSPGQESRP
ncbi:3-oxoacyl-[acyl-carrier-protein] synthase II [Micromonospora sp. A202]|uniref:beta-ketoacyl synthase N-terminal-like domain-containing protein n=1 Tax=Micromonospora sp. A202 TaxID=2572899 RepID=UPI001154D63A|nr:beta-ketoacyl synthase N-terminal-like domain-containing protein [Micromonospora sp. A202]TQJ23666.1 3-oxoacyl-[acyl-carrier-protein] synthase II [Micromonospora sp. A202]